MPQNPLNLDIKLERTCLEMQETGYAERWLERLVSAPTQSQIIGQLNILRSYLCKTIKPLLADIGFVQKIYENPVEGAPPFLIAKRLESAALPTILLYGHGDVIYGQEDYWHEGLYPFATTKRDGLIYGRGTADNKGQHLINLLALKAVLDVKSKLGFNVTLLLEMGEEIGSPGLSEFCKERKEDLDADFLLGSDGPRLMIDTPTVFLGARGALNFDLEINLREGGLHSGNWGGLVADPAIRLSQALASITDARGQIQISDWIPTSLTQKVRDIIASLPPAEQQEHFIDLNWGEEALSPNERVFGWNSFAILAMISGNPEKPVNAIAGSARATCQLRYVVGTNAKNIIPALRKHLDDHGFEDIKVSPDKKVTFAATRQNADNVWVNRVMKILEVRSGLTPHLLPNLAGSLPNECFSEVLGLVTIWLPHSYRQCCQHAPNEHIPEALFHNAIKLTAQLFNDLGS